MAQSAEDLARESIESYNAGDFDRLRSLLADDFYEEELATQRRLEGADARIEAARTWKRAFPDEHGTVIGAYTSGDTVAIELIWEGTQSGRMATPSASVGVGISVPERHSRTSTGITSIGRPRLARRLLRATPAG